MASIDHFTFLQRDGEKMKYSVTTQQQLCIPIHELNLEMYLWLADVNKKDFEVDILVRLHIQPKASLKLGQAIRHNRTFPILKLETPSKI